MSTALMILPQQGDVRTQEPLQIRCKLLAAALTLRLGLGDASGLQLRRAPGVELGQCRDFRKTINDPRHLILRSFCGEMYSCAHMHQRIVQL